MPAVRENSRHHLFCQIFHQGTLILPKNSSFSICGKITSYYFAANGYFTIFVAK